MSFENLLQIFSDKEPRPNKFTLFMGEAIRTAREEAGLSQVELAKIIYKRRATLSDIENGKVEVSTSVLTLLAHVLKKPLAYFLPWYAYRELKQEDLTPLETELLLHFRKIWDEHLQRIAVDQVRVLGEFDPREMILESAEIVADEKQSLEDLKKLLE